MRRLAQRLLAGTAICCSLILCAWKPTGAAGELLTGDEVQERPSCLKMESSPSSAGGLSCSLTKGHINPCKEHQDGGQRFGTLAYVIP